MLLQRLLRERQAESGPSFLGAEEGIEDPLAQLRGNAGPVVPDADPDSAGRLIHQIGRHLDAPSIGHRLDGVEKQVQEGAPEAFAVAEHGVFGSPKV